MDKGCGSYDHGDGVYATNCIEDCFAEAYLLLTTGTTNRGEEIDKLFIQYFPKTINAMKEHLQKIRSMKDSDRTLK